MLGLGFRFRGLGFRRLGFRVWGFWGLRVLGLGCTATSVGSNTSTRIDPTNATAAGVQRR